MKSRQLESDLKTILKNTDNIKSVTKGDVSGASIEIEYKEPVSIDSFVYYKNLADRDIDYSDLMKLIPDFS